MNEQNIQQLRDILVREFTEDELTALCRDIGLHYADLPGMGPYGKTREIITAVQEQRLVRTLMYRVQQLRPTQYLEAGLETVEPEKQLAGQQQPSQPQSGAAAVPVSGATQATPSSAVPAVSAASPTSAMQTQIDPPQPVKETSKTMNSGPRKSALPLRVRLIGFIIVVLLLAVAALSLVLQPRKGGTPVSPPPTTAVTLLPAAGAITTTGQMSPSLTVAPAATPRSIVAEDTPTPAGTVSETHPAAVAIRSINDTLVAFYMGKAKADDFKSDFAAAKYQVIINFAYKTLKTKLGADLAKGDTLNVTLRYDKVPALTAEKNGVATVVTREYWSYTNPANSKKYCDNSEYTYTLSKVGDLYQVKDFKSRAISSKCEQ
jgi:hypothetical protein